MKSLRLLTIALCLTATGVGALPVPESLPERISYYEAVLRDLDSRDPDVVAKARKDAGACASESTRNVRASVRDILKKERAFHKSLIVLRRNKAAYAEFVKVWGDPLNPPKYLPSLVEGGHDYCNGPYYRSPYTAR